MVPPTVQYTTRSAAFRTEMADAKRGGKRKSKAIKIEDTEDEEDDEWEVGEEEVDASTRSSVGMSVSVRDIGCDVPSMVGEQVEISEGGEGVRDVKNVGNVGNRTPVGLGAVPISAGAVPPPVGGRTYVIFHEDVSHLERQLISPNRTMSSLEQAKIELRGAVDREEQQLANLHKLTKKRKDLWQSIERYIDTEIDRMGGYGSRCDAAVGDYAVNEDAVMEEAGGSNKQQKKGGDK